MSTAPDEELASIAQNISLADDSTSSSSTYHPRTTLNGSQSLEIDDVTTKELKPTQEVVEKVENRSNSSERAGENDDYHELEKRIHSLSHQVALFIDRIYEIQELRHSSIPSTSSIAPTPSRIDVLLSSLTDLTTLLRPQITSLSSIISAHTGEHSKELQDGIEEIMEDWKKVEDQQRWLLEEVKEDGWLIRFRTTADQAEAMMDPLQKSLLECQSYVEKITSSHHHVPLKSDFDEQISIENLQKLAKGYGSMTKTYVPSINKILKLMDKSIAERPIKNGESLRRFTEMSQRWSSLQKRQQQLNARISMIISENRAEREYTGGEDDVEFLADVSSPYSSIDARSDYFGYGGTIKSRESTTSSYGSYGTSRTRESSYGVNSRPAHGYQSSVSSGMSSTSTRSPAARQPLTHTHTSPSVRPPVSSSLSPETAMRPLPLRRRTSMMSVTSSATARTTPAEKPRWNSSPKVPTEPVQTPTMPRRLGNLPRSVSPASSNASMTSTMSRRLSRIPIASPKGKGGTGYSSPTGRSDIGTEEISLPGLSVSTSNTRTLITEPCSVNRGQGQSQSHLERARMGLKTPEPPKPRLSSTFSSLTKSVNGIMTPPTMETRTSSSSSAPRTVPPGGRGSLGGSRGSAPPSSFRITSPTPSGGGTIKTPGSVSRPQSRSGSRLSMISYSNFILNSIEDLKPFNPSKYDLLDLEISKILVNIPDLRLFISRLDEPLKRGQRKLENEEWKGEFLFGKKEKSSSVKLLSIAGYGNKANNNQEKRVKCLIRVGGQWLDLKTELERRMKVYGNELNDEEDDETF